MPHIAIITDSTAYLPPDLVKRYSIKVIPLKIHWGEETLLDGVDITPAAFYDRLEARDDIPTTSQPSTNDFLQAFDELATGCDGIVALLVSSGISGTVASAQAAAAQFTKAPVEVVDSFSTTGGLALAVLAAAGAVEQGRSLGEVAQIARDVAQKLHVFFVVDTLKYLQKGGRIGGASRYLGTMLGIKPILFMNQEGKIDALERVRTKQKALARLSELAEEKAGKQPVNASIFHSNAAKEAATFQARLAKRIQCEEIHTFELSPVIGVHVGPGTIGVALYVK
ncbi:MAG: DegV family protein [Chloroflexota bacterium]